MEGERHLLSNQADIEATINNAIEHFLYEESFREEQKICLTFSRFFQGLWETFIFLLFPRIIKRHQRKSWRVNFHDHHRCASRSHNETKLKRFGITATTAIG